MVVMTFFEVRSHCGRIEEGLTAIIDTLVTYMEKTWRILQKTSEQVSEETKSSKIQSPDKVLFHHQIT